MITGCHDDFANVFDAEKNGQWVPVGAINADSDAMLACLVIIVLFLQVKYKMYKICMGP